MPGLKTVRIFDSTSTSFSQDGIRQTVYHPAPTRQVPNSISAIVQLNNAQIIIQHAMPNGRHIFINRNNIKYVKKVKDAFLIELIDGRSYGFGIDTKKQKKVYTQHGINPQFVMDVFCKLLTSSPPAIKPNYVSNTEYLPKDVDINYQQYPINTKKDSNLITCPICGEKYNSKININCPYCKQSETKMSNNKITNSQVNPIKIIKKSKELLDMGAITQEEFDNIKSKYLDKI